MPRRSYPGGIPTTFQIYLLFATEAVYIYIKSFVFTQLAGKPRIMQKFVVSITTTSSQFLGNMTCSYFHCYHSFNLAPYNPPLTVWHGRKARFTLVLPTSVNSCTDTNSITYLGTPKLYWTKWIITMDTNCHQRPVNKVVLPTVNT